MMAACKEVLTKLVKCLVDLADKDGRTGIIVKL